MARPKKYNKQRQPIDNISFKISIDAEKDMDMDIFERLEMHTNRVAQMQRDLNLWWKAQTSKPFILIVNLGSLNKQKKRIKYEIDLTQLNLSDEEIEMFKTGVEKKLGCGFCF